MEIARLNNSTLYGKWSTKAGSETRELEVYVDFNANTSSKTLSLFVRNRSDTEAYSEDAVILLESAEFDELLIFLGYSKTLGGTDYDGT